MIFIAGFNPITIFPILPYGFVYDCQQTDSHEIFAHLQHLFSLDEGWIYATSSQYHSDVILDVDEDFRNRTVPSGKQNSNVHQFGGCVGDGDALITSQNEFSSLYTYSRLCAHPTI